MADLFSKNPQMFGAKMASWGSYFGLGCAAGPYIGSRLQGPKSFLASALAFIIAGIYMNNIPETLEEANKKKFKYSDINPVAFLKLFKEKTLAWLAVTTGLQ